MLLLLAAAARRKGGSGHQPAQAAGAGVVNTFRHAAAAGARRPSRRTTSTAYLRRQTPGFVTFYPRQSGGVGARGAVSRTAYPGEAGVSTFVAWRGTASGCGGGIRAWTEGKDVRRGDGSRLAARWLSAKVRRRQWSRSCEWGLTPNFLFLTYRVDHLWFSVLFDVNLVERAQRLRCHVYAFLHEPTVFILTLVRLLFQ